MSAPMRRMIARMIFWGCVGATSASALSQVATIAHVVTPPRRVCGVDSSSMLPEGPTSMSGECLTRCRRSTCLSFNGILFHEAKAGPPGTGLEGEYRSGWNRTCGMRSKLQAQRTRIDLLPQGYLYTHPFPSVTSQGTVFLSTICGVRSSLLRRSHKRRAAAQGALAFLMQTSASRRPALRVPK
eukprot:scaffold539_cov359-Prasinococcus_capsulatus_cf.AAC.31